MPISKRFPRLKKLDEWFERFLDYANPRLARANALSNRRLGFTQPPSAREFLTRPRNLAELLVQCWVSLLLVGALCIVAMQHLPADTDLPSDTDDPVLRIGRRA